MKAYFYYNYKTLGDTLIITLKDLDMTSFKKHDDIVAIYNKDELIGINIFNIKKYCKIHSEGYIPLPPNALIDLVNLLAKDVLKEKISYVYHSGFYVAKIVDKKDAEDGYIYSLDMYDGNLYQAYEKENLNIDDVVVIIKDDTKLFTSLTFHKYKYQNIDICVKICWFQDLKMEPNNKKVLVLKEKVNIGEDFFKGV